MPGSWLLLPILFPLLGGLGVLGIHTLRPAAGSSFSS